LLLEKLVIPIGFDTGLLMAGIDAITGLITGAVDRTREWTEGMDALGDVTGMSEDKLAAWSFVAKKAGVEISDLSNATVIMSKGLLDSTGELSTTGKALQDFGIDVLDAGGKVRDQSALMDDIGKKYAEFGTQTERVDFLTNIFGRSGAKLVDVFDTMANEGGIDQVRKKVEALGLVLDPTQYEEFQRNLNEVDLTFTGLANAFTGPLLPGATSLLETFTKWVQSPWVAEGIAAIGESLGVLIDDVANRDWSKLWGDLQNLLPDLDPVALTRAFKDWVASVDWNQIYTTFAQWIKTVDWAGGTRAAIDSTVNILQALIDIIARTNWSALGDALKAALTGVIRDGIGRALVEAWEGAAVQFWLMVDRTLGTNLGQISQGSYNASRPSGSGGGGANRRASGGPAGGLTWVGERGAELVNLPGGSQVYNAQASASMGFDYYKLAAVLAVEFAKVRD
jgi:hypothetical protein